MSLSFFLKFLLLSSTTLLVSACEGECIVGITQAFVGNYSTHVHSIFSSVANDIVNELVPNYPAAQSFSFVSPILGAYNERSYEDMRSSIFPGYFHGKCQRNGVNPPGCPNPDCPVVCGTPGSLVHFYSTLRNIAFNSTRTTVETVISSDQSKEVEQRVRAAVDATSRPPSRIYSRSFLLGGFLGPILSHKPSTIPRPNPYSSTSDKITEILQVILQRLPARLAESCNRDLSRCSWETDMKKYILEFP